MTPTCTAPGTWPRNVRAALRAASRRVGCTSVACMEPEVSMMSITEARSTGTATVFCGRASAISSAPRAARNSSAGAQRRQAGTVATTAAAVAAAGKRTAYLRLRRRRSATSAQASSGTVTSASRNRGAWKLTAAGFPGREPVALGRQHDVLGPGAAQRARHLGAPLGLGRREALAQHLGVRVDLDQLAGLGIDELQVPGDGQRALAGVADLDGQDGVALAQPGQRTHPSVVAAEVGDHRDQAGVARDLADAPQDAGQAGRIA